MNVIASIIAVNPQIGNAGGDYHQYTRPDQFLSQFDYFDSFSRVHKTLIGQAAEGRTSVSLRECGLAGWGLLRRLCFC
jgi:hypothetical protein